MKAWGLAVTAAVAGLCVGGGKAEAWSLGEAAAPYKGTSITVVGLDRPSYKIAQQLTPEFEKATGIHVSWNIFPYEDTLKEETLNFVSSSQQFDAILSDVVWPVNFADPGWVIPLSQFTGDAKLADPALDLKDFFPVWLASFTVNGKLYGLPFDSYAGLLYYNKSMLKAAGLDGPAQDLGRPGSGLRAQADRQEQERLRLRHPIGAGRDADSRCVCALPLAVGRAVPRHCQQDHRGEQSQISCRT